MPSRGSTLSSVSFVLLRVAAELQNHLYIHLFLGILSFISLPYAIYKHLKFVDFGKTNKKKTNILY